MKRASVWMVCLLGGLAQAGFAQDATDPNGAQRQGPPPVLFLNDQILNLMMDRVSDDMAGHYEFDPEQKDYARMVIKDRFPQFFLQNRERIIRTVNGYMMGILGDDPPTPEMVATWATDALPLMEEFKGLVEESGDELRQVLSDEQQIKLDSELAAFRVGTTVMTNRMNTWAAGGYNWETEWPRSDKFQQEQQARQQRLWRDQENARRIARGEEPLPEPEVEEGGGQIFGNDVPPSAAPGGNTPEAGPQTDQAAARAAARRKGPADAWQRYVDEFIAKYKLNDAQQTAANRYLKSAQERRDAHLKRTADQRRKLEAELQKAEGDEEQRRLKNELAKLDTRVEEIFSDLKQRLEGLPTRRQRAEVDAQKPPSPPATAPAGS